jgi:hypothetical protein
MIWERERRRVWFLRGREVSPPSSRWCFLPLVSLWDIMVFCLTWFVPVRVLFPPVSFRWWCLFLITVGTMDFGYLCFCCCSTFVLTDTFRLSRLGSDLCSWSPGFLFRHIYVDTSEILRHDPPVFVRRQPLFLPPQQPAILNSHARNVVCTRWGFGLRVRATFHFSGQRGGVFQEGLLTGCSRGGRSAVRVLHPPMGSPPLAGSAFCFCFMYVLTFFHSLLFLMGWKLLGHLGGLIAKPGLLNFRWVVLYCKEKAKMFCSCNFLLVVLVTALS